MQLPAAADVQPGGRCSLSSGAVSGPSPRMQTPCRIRIAPSAGPLPNAVQPRLPRRPAAHRDTGRTALCRHDHSVKISLALACGSIPLGFASAGAGPMSAQAIRFSRSARLLLFHSSSGSSPSAFSYGGFLRNPVAKSPERRVVERPCRIGEEIAVVAQFGR